MAILIRRRNLWFLLFFLLLVIGVSLKLQNNIFTIKEEAIQKPNLEILPVGKNIDEILKENSDDFYVNYKIERERVRSLEIEILREEIINNPNSQRVLKETAQQKILEIVDTMEKEMIVENMIKAKGFEEAVVFLQKDSVNVVVKTGSLDQVGAIQIGDIVNRVTGIKMENITIIPKI